MILAPRRQTDQRRRLALLSDPSSVDISRLRVPQEIVSMMPESVSRENGVFPIDSDGETLICATAEARNIVLQDKIRFLLNRNVQFVQCDHDDLLHAINEHYGETEFESADSMLSEFTDTAVDFCEASEDLEIDEFTGRLKTRNRARVGVDSKYKAAAYSRRPSPPSDTRKGIMFYTVPEGERVLAHHRDGKIDVVKGPAKMWRWSTRFERMKHYVAHPGQYLSIRFRDGRQVTQVGPTDLWMDPREHDSVQINECVDLAAKEAVVVYGTPSEPDDEGGTSRRVFYGPGLFVPRPGEWLHRFSWHASQGGSLGKEKQPHGLQFEKLCLMPDQMYHDVRDVRTSDDAVLTIRLMIFFELVDIDKMLDTTRDPIGDFINAATSDVVEFIGKRSFEVFKQQTEQLNDIETYAQLLHRASQCGYRINNVVYRGYGAPDSLQAMHDEAIQTRTRLQLDRATEEQAQDLEDYRLKCQMERAERRRTEQMNEIEHDLDIKRQQSEAALATRRTELSFEREQREANQELELKFEQSSNEQHQAHLDSLRKMQVDLTSFLTQARADQVIEVRGRAGVKPELHLANGKKPK